MPSHALNQSMLLDPYISFKPGGHNCEKKEISMHIGKLT